MRIYRINAKRIETDMLKEVIESANYCSDHVNANVTFASVAKEGLV